MKKKILFLIYKLTGGGAEKVLVSIVNKIDKTKYDVTVKTVVKCEESEKILDSNIKYEYIFTKNTNIDRLFFKIFYKGNPTTLHKLFIKNEYDIEVAALEGIPSKIISGGSEKIKKVAIIHADALDIAWPNKRYKNFEQELDSYDRFNKLIFVSNNTKVNFEKKFNIEKDKLKVIYNPFDIEKITKDSEEKISDVKKENEKILFVAVGRLENIKGFDRLIDAIKIVYSINKNIKLIIIGDGKDKEILQKKIKKYNLNKVIVLLGRKENPYKYIKQSDCYICSSYSEGLSSTVIEATILNKPIITTDVGGMSELKKINSSIKIFENSTNGLIEGIKSFIYENELSKERKIENDVEIFSYQKYFDQLYKIID